TRSPARSAWNGSSSPASWSWRRWRPASSSSRRSPSGRAMCRSGASRRDDSAGSREDSASRPDDGADRRDRGALTLSYVIVVPVFLLALMIITQLAMWYLARNAALAAARQGVDAARVQPVSTAAGVTAAVRFARASASGYLLGPRATPAGSSAT